MPRTQSNVKTRAGAFSCLSCAFFLLSYKSTLSIFWWNNLFANRISYISAIVTTHTQLAVDVCTSTRWHQPADHWRPSANRPRKPQWDHVGWYHSQAMRTVQWVNTLIARFMGPTWGPSGADRTQVGPLLAPWTLFSGLYVSVNYCL